MNCRRYYLELDPRDTIGDIKYKIEEKDGVPSYEQRIILTRKDEEGKQVGEELKNDQHTLEYLSIN